MAGSAVDVESAFQGFDPVECGFVYVVEESAVDECEVLTAESARATGFEQARGVGVLRGF